MVGSWKINVSVNKFPQVIATATSKLNEALLGAQYTPIAYLGTQVANGTNHAVLAEQLVVTGKDTKNIVVIIFNEKPGEAAATLVSVERVVESGLALGGITVDAQTTIPEDAQKAFDSVFGGFVGFDVKPFAYLGSQVTKGTEYIFAATTNPVVKDPEVGVALVVVNPLSKTVSFVDIVTSKHDTMSLGYAFTWLKRENTSLGKPLGEWP